MSQTLDLLAIAIERGKVNLEARYPPDMKGQDGADELTRKALEEGFEANEILNTSLIKGMSAVGVQFRENKIFVPEVLMAAKAMHTAMDHLKPFYDSGDIKQKGTFVIGTVLGDLHDIGKNLVSMIIQGGGYKVLDLGTDVPAEKFIKAIEENPGCIIGMSALLTTTMASMEEMVKSCKNKFPDTKILVGGAPLSKDFSDRIGADFYSPDPQGALEFLNTVS